MNCLVVDAHSTGRVDSLVTHLTENGHKVTYHDTELEDVPAGAAPPCAAWVALAGSQDVVFLHVGKRQKNAPEFFATALVAVPVFCYTGGEAPPAIEVECRLPGIHVVCRERLGPREGGQRLLRVALRWLGPLVGRNDPERFAEAWHSVRNLDAEKETRLEELDKDLAAKLTSASWTPVQQISPELKLDLQSLTSQRIKWGI